MSDLLRKPTRRTTLRVDAGVMTEPFLDRCRTLGLREGEMLRRLIASELEHDPVVVKRRPKVSKIDSVDRTRVRKVVRFTASELEIVEAGAASMGFTVAEYLVALARAQAADVSISRDERLLLSTSNYQMAAIGRNLNQVAKMFNSDQALGEGDFRAIDDAVRAVREHVKTVGSFLLSVRARWVIGNEER